MKKISKYIIESGFEFFLNIQHLLNRQTSTVVVHFKDDDFIALKRSEFYGWTDFLSNCGGLFGLFMVRLLLF